MLNRFRQVEKCKEDIEQFSKMVQKELINVQDKDLRAIAKKMIFIKRVYAYRDDNIQYYYNCLITDILNLIHSFSKKSIRIYYTYLRSIIENFVRVLLKYENTNSTGVRKMFEELHDRFRMSNEIINYLEGEYGKCCEVIHSNRNAELPMYEYYEDIIKTDEIDKNRMDSLLRQLVTFYKKCEKLIIINDCRQVEKAFANQKEVLSYLVGKENYQEFLKISNSN